MADIFISYSKPHVELTRDLASDLEAKGLTVWWDTDLLAGESFRQRIIQELHDCKAAIVIWTPQSVSSDYVISEAERARKAGKLIQIRTEEVEPDALPPPFDTGHASLIDDRKARSASEREHNRVRAVAPVPSGKAAGGPQGVDQSARLGGARDYRRGWWAGEHDLVPGTACLGVSHGFRQSRFQGRQAIRRRAERSL